LAGIETRINGKEMNKARDSARVAHEVEHGKYLAAGSAEDIWGWGSPAGQLRARRRASLVLEGARLSPASKAIEIGCGTGLFTEMFAQSGAEIVAVDLSPELLEIARQRELPRVRFLEKNFEDCAVEGPFDAVIGSSVLHHLDLERTWSKIHSLLKPGGVMSFAEPNMLNPQVYCERHFRRFFPNTSPDETAFVRSRLRKDLENAGFHAVRIVPFDWLHPAVPEPLIPAVSMMGKLAELVWPVREFAGSLYIQAFRPA
jgi:2-polyprenyl-3-methyl-5-hydroxy-6-metoxy-1,4-benzoquinol methylase